MNIVGEGFSDSIINQVEQRQKIQGSANRTENILNYLNNKNGWVRLVSSVDVDQSVATKRGIDQSGSTLAKNYILFNGTTTQTSKPRSGIARDKSVTNNNAYGLGGLEFGLRPMPGIIQASIKTETKGALKTATVQIEANNRTQFDIIDLLYMRLGYSILLEWGHSSYYKNNGDYEKDNPFSLADEFLEAKYGYNELYPEMQKRRLNSNGNYDAILGKVVNFSWTFNPNGTYSITLIIRSMGDVIQSLKSNILLPGTVSVAPKEEEEENVNPTSTDVIVSFKDSHSIGNLFYQYQKLLYQENRNDDGSSVLSGPNSKTKDFILQEYQGGEPQYYVRLGWFLDWIQENLVPKADSKTLASLINFDTDQFKNIIYLNRYQVPIDPRVCIFQSTWESGDKKYKFVKHGEIGDIAVHGNKYGYIMNSYFNMVYILELIKNLPNTPNDSNSVGLYDLLDGLCQGWNKSTGGFNSLEFKVEEETNTVKLIDSVSLPDRDFWLKQFQRSSKDVEFKVFGLYDSKTSGFIRDLSFETTITNDLATIITVGATAEGYVLGQDATALSRMNNGLKDRIKPKIVNKGAEPSPLLQDLQNQGINVSSFTQQPYSFKEPTLEQNYKDVFINFNNFIKTLSYLEGSKVTPSWDEKSIENYSSTLTQMMEYDQASKSREEAKKSPTAASPNAGFLPFNLSLTMDGLSGIKVYQKYKMDTSYLPSNYPGTLEFLVSGITHNIVGNEWTTQLDSIAIPKNPYGN